MHFRMVNVAVTSYHVCFAFSFSIILTHLMVEVQFIGKCYQHDRSLNLQVIGTQYTCTILTW